LRSDSVNINFSVKLPLMKGLTVYNYPFLSSGKGCVCINKAPSLKHRRGSKRRYIWWVQRWNIVSRIDVQIMRGCSLSLSLLHKGECFYLVIRYVRDSPCNLQLPAGYLRDLCTPCNIWLCAHSPPRNMC